MPSMGVLGTLEGRREAEHHNAVLSVIVSAYSLLFSEGLLWPSPAMCYRNTLNTAKDRGVLVFQPSLSPWSKPNIGLKEFTYV
jgi:hypothetical protein